MRTFLPLYLLLTAAIWIVASQDLGPVVAEQPSVLQCEDGTGLPPLPPPPPGPKNQ